MVVDSPPVLTVAETVALADLTDVVLLVEDARRSTRGRLLQAVQELDHVRDRLVGAVLNGVRGGDGEIVPGYLDHQGRVAEVVGSQATSRPQAGRKTVKVHRRLPPEPRAPDRTGTTSPSSRKDVDGRARPQ